MKTPCGDDHQSPEYWKLEEEGPVDPMTKIIVHNVHDLTIDGLKRLCTNYGTIVDVIKTKSNDIAFIEFANENEATLAIQQLNSKLGFGYRANFARPKKVDQKSVVNNPVTIMNDEDWEHMSVKRRFNTGFSLPLLINFQEVEILGTSSNYISANTAPMLRRTDPEQFFLIYKVLNAGRPEKSRLYDCKEQHISSDNNLKSSINEQYNLEGGKFSFKGLTEVERDQYKAITYCTVCNGYGVLRCTKCSLTYCSVQHQRKDIAKCEALSVKTSLSAACDVEVDGGENTAPTGLEKVLSRETLPSQAFVFITSVLTPTRIFVRSATSTSNREYLDTIGVCAKAALIASSLSVDEIPVVGEIYLAPYTPLKSHGRVILIEVGTIESKCVFIEHGTLAFVRNDLLLRMDDDSLKYRKVQIYKLCLANITDEYGEWERAMEYLNQLKGQQLKLRHRVEAGNMVDVHLSTLEGENVNEKVNHLITVSPLLSDKAYDSYVLYENVPQTKPVLGENKSIMILNRTTVQQDGRVTWISMNDLPKLENLQNKLECYGKKVSEVQRNFTPRIGELCLVRCLQRWYRGVCLETAGDCLPALFLVDYGSMVLSKLNDLRKIPPQFATEVYTYDGIVEGFMDAKASDLKLDSFFLDIYLPENEPLQADISQQNVTESLLSFNEKDTHNLLKIHEFSHFMKSRQSANAPNK